jgi:hypothetical protein
MGPGKFCGTSLPNGEGLEAFACASKAALKRHQATVQTLSVPLKRVPAFLVCLIRAPFYAQIIARDDPQFRPASHPPDSSPALSQPFVVQTTEIPRFLFHTK